jgi:hypothetical protein
MCATVEVATGAVGTLELVDRDRDRVEGGNRLYHDEAGVKGSAAQRDERRR